MHSKRKQRLTIMAIILCGASLAVGLALYALSQNINLFYSPKQIALGQAPKGVNFRIGGIVKQGSVHYANSGLLVNFILTDRVNDIPVQYAGILPDLFREGQGIVAEGRLGSEGLFVAEQVLAKHSASYMPPSVNEVLQQPASAASIKHALR
jgi:cytochrome c-type biogenesis protein CcmE